MAKRRELVNKARSPTVTKDAGGQNSTTPVTTVRTGPQRHRWA
jgi:hypothetical protein